jgi:hypothetical protein
MQANMNSHIDKPCPAFARWRPAASRGRMRFIQGMKGCEGFSQPTYQACMSLLPLKVTWLVKIYQTSASPDAHSSRHPRRIRQSDGTTSVHTNPCSPFFVMYRQSCPELWACSLERLPFTLLHCGSGYFSNQMRLAKLIVRPQVLIICVITRQIQLCGRKSEWRFEQGLWTSSVIKNCLSILSLEYH